MAELAVDDDDIDLAWTINVTSVNIVVSAATRNSTQLRALLGGRGQPLADDGRPWP
jgi:hypothetical protein